MREQTVKYSFGQRVFYIVKPLVTVLIIAVAVFAPAHASSAYRWIVVAALCCCLVGDVCLLRTGKRWFLAGLVSFLLAHLFFIVAFLQGVHTWALPWWSVGLIAYTVWFAAILLPRVGRLKLPVALYCAVLLSMTLAAVCRWRALGSVPALYTLIGALLFMVSDSLLAWRHFIKEYRFAHATVMAAYWAAIALIASAV